MSDITTTQIFSNGETGITATKLNNIVGLSQIQTDFVASKPLASSAASNDQLLLLTAGTGTYSRINFSAVTSSVGSAIDVSPQITSVRLRSFNAIGNSTFEVDQRNCFAAMSNPPNQTWIQDRWQLGRGGTMAANWQGTAIYGIQVPGTSFYITTRYQRVILTTQQAALGAGDLFGIYQSIEGTQWRELAGDVTSLSLLVRTSVAGLKFAVTIRDAAATVSLCKLCTIASANTWTLITLPALPVPGSGTFNYQPGQLGYLLNIMLSVGSTYIPPANDTWQTGNFVGAVGMSNFCGQAVNSTFDIAFVQHEPGSVCTTPMDLPFTTNLTACQRYYQKIGYPYGTKPGTSSPVYVSMPILGSSVFAYGWVPFSGGLAKAPSVTLYDSNNQVPNQVYQFSSGGHCAVNAGATGCDSTGITTVVANANWPNSVNPICFQATADTGW